MRDKNRVYFNLMKKYDITFVNVRSGSDYVGCVGLIILPWELESLFHAPDHDLLIPEYGKTAKFKKSDKKWVFLVIFSRFHLIDQIFD